jgi:hypothetical protein
VAAGGRAGGSENRRSFLKDLVCVCEVPEEFLGPGRRREKSEPFLCVVGLNVTAESLSRNRVQHPFRGFAFSVSLNVLVKVSFECPFETARGRVKADAVRQQCLMWNHVPTTLLFCLFPI